MYSKKHHLKVFFKEMQFVAVFVFHMGKTRMQVKNDLRCLRQKIYMFASKEATKLFKRALGERKTFSSFQAPWLRTLDTIYYVLFDAVSATCTKYT